MNPLTINYYVAKVFNLYKGLIFFFLCAILRELEDAVVRAVGISENKEVMG